MKQDIKKRSQHRIKILQGQLRGIQKMLEDEAYCMDIITQSMAIQKSLASLNKLIVKNHIETHIKQMFEAGEGDAAENELLRIYELINIRGGEQ